MNEWTTVITDDGDVAPVGEIGLLARAVTCRSATTRTPEKTAATFTEMHGVRWAIPGDRAVIEEDGKINVLGRGSQCINTGGEKVFPEEVEAVLKSHPDVFDAIVVGVPDARWGETRRGRDRTACRSRGHARGDERALPDRARRLQGAARRSSSSTPSSAPPRASPTTAGPKPRRSPRPRSPSARCAMRSLYGFTAIACVAYCAMRTVVPDGTSNS